MIAEFWILTTIVSGLLGLLFWQMRAGQERLLSRLQELLERVHKMELKLGQCITWADLDRRCEPMERDQKDLERRVTVVETRCSEHHKGP